jgi:hypothetical protein
MKTNVNYNTYKVWKWLLEVELPSLYEHETKKMDVRHVKNFHNHLGKQACTSDLKSRLEKRIMDKPENPMKSPDLSFMEFSDLGVSNNGF